jgi:hypothetical protein
MMHNSCVESLECNCKAEARDGFIEAGMHQLLQDGCKQSKVLRDRVGECTGTSCAAHDDAQAGEGAPIRRPLLHFAAFEHPVLKQWQHA